MNRELSCERLLLRPPRPGDELAAHVWASDPQVLRHLPWRPHVRLQQTRAQLDWDQARWLKRSAWTWLLVEAQVPVGLVQLVPQQLEGAPHHLRVGYVLARSHWGRGLMREALAAVLAEAFAHDAVWRVDAVCDLDNRASARVLQAVGFTQEGVLRRHSLHPNVSAEPRDVLLFARLREAGPRIAADPTSLIARSS